MAGIEVTSEGRGRCYWNEGGRRMRTVTMTLEECQYWLAEHQPNAKRLPLAVVVDRWVASRGNSDHALDVQGRLVRLFNDQQWRMPNEITPQAIQAWNVAAGGRALDVPGTGVARTLQYLLGVLRYAADMLDVPIHPRVLRMRQIKPAKKPPRPLLTESQVVAIQGEALQLGQRAAALIEYLLQYGPRPKTACLLRQSDLVCRDGVWLLTIDKAKHSGGWTHPVREREALLWRSLSYADGDPTVPLFPHWREDRPWRVTAGRADEVKSWYRNTIGKRLQLPARQNTIYRLKDYALSRMLGAGLDPATIALFTGHADKSQILTYNQTNSEKAAAALITIEQQRKAQQGRRVAPAGRVRKLRRST